MKRLLLLALGAALVACAPQAPDLTNVQIQVTPDIPEGPRIRYRPVAATPYQTRTDSPGTFGAIYSGTITIAEVAPNRLRMTRTLTQMDLPNRFPDSQSGPLAASFKFADGGQSSVEIDPSGRYLVIDPSSPEFAQSAPGGTTRIRDWMELFASLENMPVYRADLTLGTPIFPTTREELLERRTELLEAMVRGNTSGAWADLPRGTAMTPAQREFFVAAIRTRSLPAVYESDVRIRGSTTIAGRTVLYASGRTRTSFPNGVILAAQSEFLLDPASGLVVFRRTRPSV